MQSNTLTRSELRRVPALKTIPIDIYHTRVLRSQRKSYSNCGVVCEKKTHSKR